MVLNIQETRIVEFLSSIKKNISCFCEDNNVILKVSHSFKDKDCNYFDAFRIEEMLLNIVSNSLKYTKQDDEILLESFIKNNLLVFKVSDTGKGFKSQTDMIFNKYYKENENTSHKNSSGLGLYICKLIAEKHNGNINAYNNAQGGATVEFSIPTDNICNRTAIYSANKN
ncbi:ATP-binding protein [Clostridiaceae bacterium M8S5]|nr:ATP-binding protein [Clostridiaceae bacterium M8S5]